MTFPIVLAHGIAPFDQWTAFFGWNAYFKFVKPHLESDLHGGFEVVETRVDFAGTLEERSADLQTAIDRAGIDRCHIIAHSMGGLDARHMIVHRGMAGRVASLTTIGTPHHGTSFADVGLERGGDEAVSLLAMLGLDTRGVHDLTREACAKFNRDAEPAEAENAVRYIAVEGHQPEERVLALLRPSWQVIQEEEGDNDGLVPITSQRWTPALHGAHTVKRVEQVQFPIGVDHLNEVGWWDPAEYSGWNPFRARRAAQAFERTIRDFYAQRARAVALEGPG